MTLRRAQAPPPACSVTTFVAVARNDGFEAFTRQEGIMQAGRLVSVPTRELVLFSA